MSRVSSIIVAVIMLICPAKCWPTSQFDQFFPSWNGMLQEMLQDSCSDWLAGYKNQTENAYRVVDCLLDELKEYRKIEMAASAVNPWSTSHDPAELGQLDSRSGAPGNSTTTTRYTALHIKSCIINDQQRHLDPAVHR
ncbi:unnamed protein product [Clonostachys rhizophaga]|uniref:Uncharacterized protein n=1 Tax=Clonostachys rhizophaga TaxID=160324 RepID=A0A9N9YNX4_9HYPO|nr:unnamed protein product [Clonostachys rhizophaga]